jgi:uncharacterized protein (DUF305 family)
MHQLRPLALALLAGASIAAPAAHASSQAVRAASHASSTAYGRQCADQSKRHLPGGTRSRFSKCVTAMAKLARAETRAPRSACSALPSKRAAGSSTSPQSRCVKAGTALIRRGNGIDRAFADAMIAHHLVAIEMAQLALTQGQSDVIRAIAASITSSQNAEIATLRQVSAALQGAGMKPVTMGLSKAQMGVGHDDVSRLVGASPFDVFFIDMMVPHDQAAIAMSGVLLERGVSATSRGLAQQITRTQAADVELMRAYRIQLTGSPGPDEGVIPH